MTDSTVQIAFGGDASGATAAAGEAKTAVTSIYSSVKDLGSSLADLGEQAAKAFSALKGGGGGEAAATLAGMVNPALGVAKALVSVGEAAWDTGKLMAATADATAKLSEKYGVSATTAQTYQGVATLLGESVDTVANAAESGQQSLAQYNGILDQYGVRSQDAAEKGGALSGAFRENQLGAAGVTNVFTSALAPVIKALVDDVNDLIKAFVQSYNSGGLVKGVLTAVAVVIGTVVEVVDTLVSAFGALISIQVGVSKVVGDFEFLLGSVVVTAIKFAISNLGLLGRAVADVFTGNWGDLKSVTNAWVSGVQVAGRQVVGEFADTGQRIVAHSQQTIAELTADLKGYGQRVGETVFGVGDKVSIPTKPLVRPPPPQNGLPDFQANGSGPSWLAASPAAADQWRTQLDQAYLQDADNFQAALSQKTGVNATYNATAVATTVKAVSDHTQAVATGLTTDEANLAKFKQEWGSVMDPIVSGFSRGLLQMAEGTKSFAQVMGGIGQMILNDMLKVVDHLVETWLWGVAQRVLASTQGQALLNAIGMKSVADAILQERAKAGATVAGATARTAATTAGASAGAAAEGAGALASIGTSAAKAAAAVYGDIASSFGPAGPFVAPVFAGAALAAVLDYRGLVRSASGGFDIPSGLNPLTQLHAEEMVLPATLANPLRNVLAGYSAANFNAPTAANSGGGDTHNHYYNIHAMDGPSFRGFLRGNSDHLSTVLQEMGRRGQKTG